MQKKGCLLLTKIKTNTVNTCFVCEILKMLIGNMLNSMKESPTFYPFSSCITSWVIRRSDRLVRLLLARIVQRCNISCIVFLTAHNWQKWKRVFLTWPSHKIYRVESVGLKSSNYTWKIMIGANMWNLGQVREKLIFCQ